MTWSWHFHCVVPLRTPSPCRQRPKSPPPPRYSFNCPWPSQAQQCRLEDQEKELHPNLKIKIIYSFIHTSFVQVLLKQSGEFYSQKCGMHLRKKNGKDSKNNLETFSIFPKEFQNLPNSVRVWMMWWDVVVKLIYQSVYPCVPVKIPPRLCIKTRDICLKPFTLFFSGPLN